MKKTIKLTALLAFFCAMSAVSLPAYSTGHQAKTYSVNGKSYTTRTYETSKGYQREGGASYYHNKFNGRRTASGEVYNSSKLTAAHKTLPLGSYALVTNLRNQKQVVVKINDRGPFSHSRIIDLSYAAANQLGIIRAGVGQVRVEALPGKPQQAKESQGKRKTQASVTATVSSSSPKAQTVNQPQRVKATIATPEQIAALKAQKAAETQPNSQTIILPNSTSTPNNY